MYFKVNEIRPYVLYGKVRVGKIIEVNKRKKTYIVEDIHSKEQYELLETSVFIGDD